ncbi:MAG TPA: zinc/iron-chelating domain-containing protein [Bdellovibrionales bacterium]|nr:zinc/iron-chelating domain-containing protein [Pseudobdellovibrionaceae bacterium]HAG90573.1 zinc/iron-chelating domain-containing protein [Bdellovibrionales bacterium]
MKLSLKKHSKFIEKGLHFQCQGSGKCCVSRGEYGEVYLTREDRKKMAEHLGLSVGEFKKKYCAGADGVWGLIQPEGLEDCIFLKDKRCQVYEARPTQCRTWPFWPENMNAKAWKKEVVAFCPGAQVTTKKSLRSSKEIEKELSDQIRAEKEIFES